MKTIRQFADRNKGLFSVLAILIAALLLYGIGPIRFCFVPTGSMEPNIPTWSLCIINIRTPYESIEEGDIVVYHRKSDGLRIIHRVIGSADGAFVTKGDANRIDDGPSVTPDNFFGKYLFHIPGIGKPLSLAKTPAGIAVTAAVFLGLLIWLAADDRRERERKRKQEHQEGQEQNVSASRQ